MHTTHLDSIAGGDLRLPARAGILLFTGFLAILFLLPALVHSQWISGPVVNAVLLLAVVLLGPLPAAALGAIPGFVALAAGLLPMPLAPMLPFIVLGNWALVVVVHYLRRREFAAAMVAAASAKFAVIFASFLLVFEILMSRPLSADAAEMMSWPQLVTALAGGVIALGVLTMVKRQAKRG
ncbi:MAG: ECF transporter S component [Spirochaetes bacterium]|nr:ECF transporter S component [Spirochaetota bacterium]